MNTCRRQITLRRACCSGNLACSRIVLSPGRKYIANIAAVNVRLERNASSTKPIASRSLEWRAVQHLRKLGTAARTITHTPTRLSKARDQPVKELLAMVGLAHGASRLTGSLVESLGAKGLADLLWALAALGGVHYLQEEMDAVLEVVDFQQQRFTARQLLDVSWSLATATHWTPKTADLAAAMVQRGGLRAALGNSNLTAFFWSFAVLNFNPPVLFADVLPPEKVATFTTSQLISACWSLCVLQETRSELFQTLWKELGAREPNSSMTSSKAAQLSQIKMGMTVEEGALLVTDAHRRILREAERLWRERLVTEEFHMSAQHKDTCTVLKSMGVDFAVEDVSSGYAVDIAIPSLRVAVEIDGPSHFARNAKRRLGPSAMKHRQLTHMGWHVFSLKVEDWDSAQSCSEALQNLREVLQTRRDALQSASGG